MGSGQEEIIFMQKVVNFKGKLNIEKAKTILKKKYYHYNFGDGWSAGINVSEIDAKDAMWFRKNSNGFCGYDWMVDSIVDKLKIEA